MDFLKDSGDILLIVLLGRLFQSEIVRGKKLNLYVSVSVWGLVNLFVWLCLVEYVFCWGLKCDGMDTDVVNPLTILYICTSRASLLRAWRGLHCSCSRALPTHPVSRDQQLVTKRADFLWTFSTFLICSCVCGSHVVCAYSKIGLTSEVYAWDFTFCGHWWRFRRIKPRALFAFDVTWWTCLFHFRSFCTWTPRYSMLSTWFRGWPPIS